MSRVPDTPIQRREPAGDVKIEVEACKVGPVRPSCRHLCAGGLCV